MRARIEQLEKRQTQDDAVLCVVNRYWNLLNEDIRVLLQRFDAETADESENKSNAFFKFHTKFQTILHKTNVYFQQFLYIMILLNLKMLMKNLVLKNFNLNYC